MQTKNLGDDHKVLTLKMEETCRSCYEFKQALLYYKSLHYSPQIALNSFRIDITKAVKFINFAHETQL